MCPSSLCSQPFPILNRLSSWRGERQGAHCTRFSHTKKGHFVEHGVRVWLGRGVGAGALTWAGRAQDPLLCICFPCTSNSPQLHLPFVSLAVIKHFFFSLQAHHSSNTNILHASLLPRLFPPLLCLAEHLQPSPACPRASTHQQDLQGSATPHLSSIEVASHLTSDLRPTVLFSSTQARVTMQKTTCLKKDMKFPAATSNHARQSWLQGAF